MSDTVEGEFTGAYDGIGVDGLHNVYWKTKDGRLVCIKDMTDSHIRNTAMFLTGFGYMKCIARTEQRLLWLRVLKIEWDWRMINRITGLKRFKFNPEENQHLIND